MMTVLKAVVINNSIVNLKIFSLNIYYKNEKKLWNEGLASI